MAMKNMIHRFDIPVDCAGVCGRGEGAIYYDHGMIALPDSYSERGKPTRLVISCHGAGGTVTTNDSQIESQELTKYLLANGYAVMDMNGLPAELAAEAGINIRNNIGSPIAVQSYRRAYHYCMDRFNLYREVFVHGGSMGGISSTNLVMSESIPVIAQSGFCPVLDTKYQIFEHPWSGGLPRRALGLLYGLEIDGYGEFIYDEDKVRGYNPMGHISLVDGRELLSYPVPVKFWQCEDDGVVSIECTRRFVAAIKNAGGEACLCTLECGGHEPQLYGESLDAPAGKTVFCGETLEIKPAVEGVFLWIKSFDF